MVTKASKKSVSKPRNLTAKQETEKEQLETKIERNEERLNSGLAGNGIPLTENQIEATRLIVRTQRERLTVIEGLVEIRAD